MLHIKWAFRFIDLNSLHIALYTKEFMYCICKVCDFKPHWYSHVRQPSFCHSTFQDWDVCAEVPEHTFSVQLVKVCRAERCANQGEKKYKKGVKLPLKWRKHCEIPGRGKLSRLYLYNPESQIIIFLKGLYNLYSMHPQSLDPRFRLGKTPPGNTVWQEKKEETSGKAT